MPELRDLPSIDKLLQVQAVEDLVQRYGRPLTVEALRAQFKDWPIKGLEQMLVIRGGKVVDFPL